MNTPKNPAAVALGRLGGSKNTPAQDKARALNARKGGWPKGRQRKVAKPYLIDGQNEVYSSDSKI